MLGLAAVFAPLVITMRLLADQIVFVLVASGAVLMSGLTVSSPAGKDRSCWQDSLRSLFSWCAGQAESAQVQAELSTFAVTATGLGQNLLRLGFAAALLYFGSRLVVHMRRCLAWRWAWGRC